MYNIILYYILTCVQHNEEVSFENTGKKIKPMIYKYIRVYIQGGPKVGIQ